MALEILGAKYFGGNGVPDVKEEKKKPKRSKKYCLVSK